jgi:hypothetical protein
VAPAVSPNAAAIAESTEEVRFYLTQQMVDQARTALKKLEGLGPEEAVLTGLRAEIEAATANAATQPEAVEEIALEADDAPVSDSPVEAPMVVEAAAVTSPTPTPAIAAQEEKQPELPVEAAKTEPAPEPPAAISAPAAQSADSHNAGVLDDFVADLESSLGEDFLPESKVHPVAAEPVKPPAPRPAAAHASVSEPQQDETSLGDFVSELEASLGDSFLPEAPRQVPVPAATTPAPAPAPTQPIAASEAPPIAASAAAAAGGLSTSVPVAPPSASVQPGKPKLPAAVQPDESGANVDLANIFGDLKQELEEDTAAISADEDPETHYNLGVAFREMGLLDEAIGELQKVCQYVEKGNSFPHVMQTYTWLAQCFLDQGVPDAAVNWYERALTLPNLDGETRTALHYELASAFEAAGDKPAALRHFTTVYGSNIDYRDITERIKALKS